MKSFLSFLCLAVATFVTTSLPALPTLASHVSSALALSRADPWTLSVWWNRNGSWVFFGGPFGRWPFGIFLGFVQLKATRDPPGNFPGQVVEQPHLRMAALASIGFLVSLIAVVRFPFNLLAQAFRTNRLTIRALVSRRCGAYYLGPPR